MITIYESLNIQFKKLSHVQSDFFQFYQEVEKYEKNRNERRPLSNG